MIAVADYGTGNLRSVQKAFCRAGFDARVCADARGLRDASHIVLPGVGAFKDASELIFKTDIAEIVTREAEKGKPILGICLGMQLLFERSFEGGEHRGLGLLKGDCVKFAEDAPKIPHIGWNDINIKKREPLFEGVNDNYFYFVHSYYVAADVADAAATTFYGREFCSAAARENVFGTQFHPEKSGTTGLTVIKNFGGIR